MNVSLGSVSGAALPVPWADEDASVTVNKSDTAIPMAKYSNFVGGESPGRSQKFPAKSNPLYQQKLGEIASPERKQVIDKLEEWLLLSKEGTPVHELLSQGMPQVRHEWQQRQDSGVGYLQELLFALKNEIGRVSTARSVGAAAATKIAANQARISGDKTITAAQDSLGGAASAMILGGTVSAISFAGYAKSARNQIASLEKNGRPAQILQDQQHALIQQSERPGANLSDAERDCMKTEAARTGRLAVALRHAGERQDIVHRRKQYGAQMTGNAAQVIAAMGTSTGNVVAAGSTAEAKVRETDVGIAETLARNESDAKARSEQIMQEIESWIEKLAENHNATISAMAGNIRA